MFQTIGHTINWLTGVVFSSLFALFFLGFVVYYGKIFGKELWRDLSDWWKFRGK